MTISIDINHFAAGSSVFLGYTPLEVTLTLTNRVPGPLKLRITSTGTKAALSFYSSLTGAPSNALNLLVPNNVSVAKFFVGGKFGSWSDNLNDGQMTVTARKPLGPILATTTRNVSVRVRRNANAMTIQERDRFLAAYSMVNNSGAGIYQALRDMHTNVTSFTIHGGVHFLPWHRAFILQLERELQSHDPLVCLPYWRFDQSAPKVFSADFMGTTTQNSNIVLSATNPLTTWVTDGTPLWARRLSQFPPNIATETTTLGFGTTLNGFITMEGDPHGSAHVQFQGPISNIGLAVKDPLFFLLHCNVDRLWALWQFMNNR